MREDCTNFAEKLASLFSDIILKSLTMEMLREADDLGLTLSQYQALLFVAERPASSITDVAEGLGVTHPAAVKLIQRLQEKALVTRAVAAGDQRQASLTVSTRGRALLNHLRLKRTDRLSRVLDRMTPADRQAMIQGLESFVTIALNDERALDQICWRCQQVQPTDCADFAPVLARLAATHGET